MEAEFRPSDPITPIELERIEALAAAATNGPWTAETRAYSSEGGKYRSTSIPGVCNEVTGGSGWSDYGPLEPEDGEFIAAARTYVPASVIEIRRLNAALEVATAEGEALRIEKQMLIAQIARDYYAVYAARDMEGK